MASLAFPKRKKEKKKKRTRTVDDSESDNDFFSNKGHLPRFIAITSAIEEQQLSKLSPLAVQKGSRQ